MTKLETLTDQDLARMAGALTSELVQVLAEYVRRHPDLPVIEMCQATMLKGLLAHLEAEQLSNLPPATCEVQ